MAQKEADYDSLIEEALSNAIEDRKLTKDAYVKMKDVFDIDVSDPNSLQAAMFVGSSAVKLLEQLTRSNEQIIKLSQLRQKDKSKVEVDKPIDLSKLREELANSKLQ